MVLMVKGFMRRSLSFVVKISYLGTYHSIIFMSSFSPGVINKNLECFHRGLDKLLVGSCNLSSQQSNFYSTNFPDNICIYKI